MALDLDPALRDLVDLSVLGTWMDTQSLLEGTYARACAGKADRSLGEMFHGIACSLIERAQTFTTEGVTG